MYIWNTDGLTRQLRAHGTSMVHKLLYLFILVVQYATGLLIFQAVPTVYRALFTYAKKQLEAQTGHPSLLLRVYEQTPDWYPVALGMVLAVGLLACILSCYPGTLRSYIDRFICLNTPISLRILFVTLLFFCLTIVFAGLHFTNQLYTLSETISAPQASSNALYYMWTLFTKVTGLKIILNSLALLEGAQHIFKEINQFSYHAYLASYWIALVSTALYFWQLQKHMRCSQPKT